MRALRALLSRALGETNARDAPALVDLVIESAGGRRLLRIEFSNGYRASAPLAPHDCLAFCEQRSVWDIEGFRRVLLSEARQVYGDMLQERTDLERAAQEQTAREQAVRQQTAQEIVQEQTVMREGRQTWIGERMRRLGEGIAQTFRPRREAFHFPGFGSRALIDERRSEAHVRGMRLLRDNLTPVQRQQYDRYGYFEVVGGKTGKRYRIRHGRSMNIDQLDRNGRRVCGWCFFPEGNLVTGDVMLAQKTALELFEAEALKIANKMW